MAPNRKNLERHTRTCRHFSGVQNKTCKAGINYDDVAPIPCIGLPLAGEKIGNCEKKSCYTQEEAIKIEEEHAIQTKRFMTALSAAHEAADKLGLKKGHGGAGSCECPVCGGTLQFSVASCNGHLWGKCKTPDCMAWME